MIIIMDIDEMKNRWQDLSIRANYLEKENRQLIDKVTARRAETTQKRLASIYLWQSFIGALLPLLSPLVVLVLGLPLWIGVCYGLFGIVMTVANLSMRRYILRTDYINTTVVQSIERTIKVRKRIVQLRVLSICLGLPIILSFGLELASGQDGTMIGFLSGIIIGLAIGITKWVKQQKLTRSMLEELKNVASGEQTTL